MLLTAALIVRNEADKLRRCLASVADVVDEVVVVDTGSEDGTPEVAAAFGARVLHRPWDGDFSAARNFGLDRIRDGWILYIDADEHLAPTTRAEVEAQMEDRDRHIAYRIRLRSRPGFTPYREYRLWRHHAGIRFTGVIHESHGPAIEQVARTEGLAIGRADLLLEHDGYEGDLTAKHHRNLPLLERQVVHDPDRTYLWDEMGRARLGLGDRAGARQAWTCGVEAVRRNGVRSHTDCLVYLDLIHANVDDGRLDPSLVAEADATFPGNPLLLWAGALHALADGDHRQVVERIDDLLSHDAEDVASRGLFINQRVIGDWAHHARGMARFHLGDHAGAAEDFAAAERLAPDAAEYRVKRQLAEARRDRSGTS